MEQFSTRNDLAPLQGKMYGDIFGHPKWDGVAQILWVQAGDDAQYHTMHRDIPPPHKPPQNVCDAQVKKHGLNKSSQL